MTVKKDLEKALAAAESAKGTYATFAASTDDPTGKQMFQQMSQEMDQHISNIQTRLNSTAENQLSNQTTSSIADAANKSKQDYLQ